MQKKLFLTCFVMLFLQHIFTKFSVFQPVTDFALCNLRTLYELPSKQTFMTAAFCIPVYGLARIYDESIQSNFFCYEEKKNINQPNSFIKYLTHEGFIFFAGGFILYNFLSGILEENKRMYLNAIGMGTGLFVSTMLKLLVKSRQFDGNLRPYHEILAPEKRVYGGCPSGHTATVCCAATYVALEYGIEYALPLIGLSIVSIASLVNINRHYFSQTVAGAGLGVVIGFAAHKAVEFLSDLCEDITWKVDTEVEKQNTFFSVEYSF